MEGLKPLSIITEEVTLAAWNNQNLHCTPSLLKIGLSAATLKEFFDNRLAAAYDRLNQREGEEKQTPNNSAGVG